MNISKVKHIVHRGTEEVKSTLNISSKTSLKDALCVFHAKLDIQKMCKNGYLEPEPVRNRLIKKHDVLLTYFEEIYKPFLESYQYPSNESLSKSNYKNCIWMCWWQGLENAPEIVKVCVNSVQKHSNGHRVIIITEQNVNDYVHFPDKMNELYKKGIISRTHLSDLLRLSLLAEHGGIWLDATCFCTKDIPEKWFTNPVWSIKRLNYPHCSVASGNFANYSLGCNYGYRWIYKTITDLWIHYWDTNSYLVDYLLTDYLIVLAQRHNHQIKDVFSLIQPNNPKCDDLLTKLNEPFNLDEWYEIKKDTIIFKLSWKEEFLLFNNNNKETYYSKLINNLL